MSETAGKFYIYSLAKPKNMDKEIISNQSNNFVRMNKYIAYLFGVFLTDGYICKENKFQLQVIDRDFAERVLFSIKEIVPSCKANVYERMNQTPWNKKKQYCINAGFSSYASFFKEQTLEKRKIPHAIYDSPKIIQQWFIAGVMDGDGFITMYKKRKNESSQWKIGLGKSEDGWILAFVEFMLRYMGVKHYPVQRTLTKKGTPFITVRFNHEDFIKSGCFFSIERKQSQLKELQTLLLKAQRLDTTHPDGAKV